MQKDVLNGSQLDQLACIHYGHPVGNFADDPEAVTDEENRRVELVLQYADEIQYLRLDRDIQTGSRLVHDQQGRVCQ